MRDWQVVRRREISARPPRPGTEDELYVVFHIQEWKRLAEPVKPGGSSIYTHLFTTRYMLERAREIAELRLETEEQLKEWREKRRLGKVKVELDHEYVDRAGKVLGVKVEE